MEIFLHLKCNEKEQGSKRVQGFVSFHIKEVNFLSACYKTLAQKAWRQKLGEIKIVQLDVRSALIRLFLCEYWNLVKISYLFGLSGLERHCARNRIWHWGFRYEILHINS